MMTRLFGSIVALTALAVAPGASAAGARTLLHISSHLAHAAKASLDGAAAVSAPGYGSVNVPAVAGKHVLKVTTAAGVTYAKSLDLEAVNLMKWKGRGYWCVNLLANDLEVYSAEDCDEEVTDAG